VQITFVGLVGGWSAFHFKAPSCKSIAEPAVFNLFTSEGRSISANAKGEQRTLNWKLRLRNVFQQARNN
jgi:hypothetical protein